MNLSKITIFKNFIYLFIFCLFIISCEPEEVPDDNTVKRNSVKLFSDTGNQENPPEGKG